MVAVRRSLRVAASELGFGITDVTRIVTAASELSRNIFRYAGSGTMKWRALDEGGRTGIEITFEDKGPGIVDVEQAMQSGYSTGGSLGMGLPGAQRLMDDFDIRSSIGKGTTIVIKKWVRR